jgi:hypothetical protein
MRNPWMSAWMSGANTVFGAARAQAHRNANRMVADGFKRGMSAWTGAMAMPAAAKPARKRTKR